jgi:hypothetical protein
MRSTPDGLWVIPLVSLAIALSAVIALTSQNADASQRIIANELLSGDPGLRSGALAKFAAIPPAEVGPELAEALISLLEQQNALARSAELSGRPLASLIPPEEAASVQRAVASLRRPETIDALAGALGMFTVVRQLASFGESSAPAVIDVVVSPTSSTEAVNDGLRVLRLMVERQQTDPLSARTLQRIREVVGERLNGQQYFTVLAFAAQLAVVLGDEELNRMVERLATSEAEVKARGVTDPMAVSFVRDHARRAAAGEPSFPRPDP